MHTISSNCATHKNPTAAMFLENINSVAKKDCYIS